MTMAINKTSTFLSLFQPQIQFDNSNHDGRVPVKLGAHGTLRNCGGKFIDDDDGMKIYP